MAQVIDSGVSQAVVLPHIFDVVDPGVIRPDIVMSYEGDLQISDHGDLDLDLQGDRNITSNIVRRILCEESGLKTHLNYGAALDRYIGSAIDSELVGKIKSAIIKTLTVDTTIVPTNIKIEVARLDETTLVVLLAIDLTYKNIVLPLIVLDAQTGSITIGDS